MWVSTNAINLPLFLLNLYFGAVPKDQGNSV